MKDVTVELQTHTATTHFLVYNDVTSPTNQRTMIAACLPRAGVVNSAPIVMTDCTVRKQLCLLANLNSFIWDDVVRQKVGNLHLNFFIVEQVPTLLPDRYDEPCPWSKGQGKTLEAWIAERVLKLTCTAEDMLPLADACGFADGSLKAEYVLSTFKGIHDDNPLLSGHPSTAKFIMELYDRYAKQMASGE